MNKINKPWAIASVFVALSVVFLVRFGAVAQSTPQSGGMHFHFPGVSTFQLPFGGMVGEPMEPGDAVLGGLIHNIQESFDAGIAVDGTEIISGSGEIKLGGGTFTGLMGSVSSTMSSSATTTACAIYNGEGRTRMVTNLGVVDTGTAASLGAIAWVAGTSTAQTGSAVTSNIVNGTITRRNGIDVITTTSTAQSATMPWGSGTYLKFVSNTTTNAGKCWATYQ